MISTLPGLALRTHVESLGKSRDVNKRSQSLAWYYSLCIMLEATLCVVCWQQIGPDLDSNRLTLCVPGKLKGGDRQTTKKYENYPSCRALHINITVSEDNGSTGLLQLVAVEY